MAPADLKGFCGLGSVRPRLARTDTVVICAMALPVSPELIDLLSRQVDAPIEWVSVVSQCSLAQVRGIAVSAGRVLDFVFDAERKQLRTWLRFELTERRLAQGGLAAAGLQRT